MAMRKINWVDVLTFILLLGGGLIVTLPLVWMVVGSFRPVAELLRVPPIIFPRSFTLANYVKLLGKLPIVRFFINSIIVTSVQLVSVLLTSSFAGHIFSKYEFKGKNFIFLFLISTLMLPFYAYVIPLFLLVSKIGWGNTYQGIFGPWLVLPFGIFLMRQFMREIPLELVDSAKIDGASEGRIYFQIILPLSKPALGALGIFVFMWSWNDFFWPLVIVTKMDMFTLPVGIATFVAPLTFFPEVGSQFAIGTIMVLPLVVMYLLFHKTFTRGVALTGIK